MKKLVLSVVAAVGLSGPAFAADVAMPKKAAPVVAAPATPVFDIAFGGAVMSDYNFRGVSQSNKGPSGGAYFEPQFNTAIGTLYAGVAAWAIDWPGGAGYGFTNPSAEVDLYGGWRNTFGALSVDLGFIYYYYPREVFNGFTNDSDFWEIYAKLSYAINADLSLGANVFYSPDVLNYSQTFKTLGVNADASGLYASMTGKWVTPWKSGDFGAYVSGELGHWWIDDKGFKGVGLSDPSYTYWNAGFAITYKALTVDLRYHGTDMSKVDCGAFLVTGVPNKSNNWCADTFIVSLKFDTTLAALK